MSGHRASSNRKPEHQSKILDAYRTFADKPGFAAVMTHKEVLAQGGNLSIPRHVKKALTTTTAGDAQRSLDVSWAVFEEDGREFWTEMDSLVKMLDGIGAEEAGDA